MTGFPDILDLFPPQRVSRHVEDCPDAMLHGPQPAAWPDLQGVVGIFFTSRSGSTALSRLAERHFAVERVGETLNASVLQRIARRRSCDGLQAALAWGIEKGSPQGWYLFKAGGAGLVNAARIGFLDRYGPMIRPILLLRQDIVAQALSIFFAVNTKRFHSTQPARHELTEADFDQRRIEDHIAVIAAGNALIAGCLERFAHPARLLLYEGFAGGDAAGALAMLADAGLPPRPRPRIDEAREVARVTHPLSPQFHARFMDGLTPRGEALIARHAALIATWQARGT